MIGQNILGASRWMLLLTVVLAAWLWGGTRPWTSDVICWLLLADASLFLAGLIAIRRLPRVPSVAVAAISLLLLQGWLLAWNSPVNTSNSGTGTVGIFHPIGVIFPFLPAFEDRVSCTHTMLLITGLIGAFCMACDLSANRLWRIRLWITIAATGASIVALGLAQRLTDAPAIFWNVYENTGTTFFGVFRYHANAGAFINLVLPMLAGLTLLSLLEQWPPWTRVLWTVTTLATMASAFVNVSRGAMTITGIIVFVGLIWLSSSQSRQYSEVMLLGMIVFIATALLLLFSFGIDDSESHWKGRPAFDTQRYLTDQVIVDHVLPLTGFFGSGPGTFEPVFAFAVSSNHLPYRGRWDKAHNDHLQTIVEWGWIGYSLWAVLLLGALYRGIRAARSRISVSTSTLGICGTLALGGVLLHATIDFPLQIASIQLFTALIAGMLWSGSAIHVRGRGVKHNEGNS